MVGIVVVSHSRRLAEAAVELALGMVHAVPPPIEIAAGLDDDVLGTDAAAVKEAIDRVASPAGVLVLMDLGSALLSAELAKELRGSSSDCAVVLSDGPLVEGLVAAVALAAASASLCEVAAEAGQAARAKTALLGAERGRAVLDTTSDEPAAATIQLAIRNEHGLHARPAARLVETVRRFDADITVRNLANNSPSASGRSLSALSTLGALKGHRIEVSASGTQSHEALAAIAALVDRDFGEVPAVGELPPAVTTGPLAASPGIVIGPKTSLMTLRPQDLGLGPISASSERERLLSAIDAARAELSSTRAHVASSAGEEEAGIFDAHLMLLDDEELPGRALELIEQGPVAAEEAWSDVVAELGARFAALPDPYQSARAADVRAVGDQVLGYLGGPPTGGAKHPAGIVVTADLTPTQVAHLDLARVVGLVTAFGTPLSHAAILARSLGIPAVVATGKDILTVEEGATILVDGSAGVVIVDPSPSVAEQYREEAARRQLRAAELLEHAGRRAVSTDGVRVEVCATIASRDDALQAVKCGADGVGVLRTEFLFQDRPEPPAEDEQLKVYLSIAEALEGRRLTIRTLDIGGDKPVPYLSLAGEANPFLGRRGLRLSLQHPEMFKQQLRAVIRTAMNYPVTVLFPMVTTVDELRAARALLDEAALEVGCRADKMPAGWEVGAMAEVPAFALRAHAAVPLVDVISIGCNDLTQYALAAERGNTDVASLADPLDPAVLSLIALVTRAAHGQARVAICGEIASDPVATALLVGLGARELSMTPGAIPEVKDAVRSLSLNEARQVAELALQQASAAGVRALLSDTPKRGRARTSL